MPIIKSAIKKVRKDKKRTKMNKLRSEKVKKILKETRKNPTAEKINLAQSLIDKLAKVKVIHKNKAARLKSQIAKLLKKSAKPESKNTAVVDQSRKKQVKKTKAKAKS